MSKPDDNDLDRLLNGLPRHEASPEFTHRVLARLDDTPPAPTRVRWAWGLAAAAVLVVIVWLGAAGWRERVELAEQRQAAERAERAELERLEMMRDEYRELELELEALRALAREAEPVLVLGGTEDVELVFDLRRQPERARAQPTSHSPR